MKKIAIYGKGGSGKSTVSSALSVALARRGLKVLQVGCDPKADSTLVVMDGVRPPTLLDLLAAGISRPRPEQFVVEGRLGIDCIEAGGPKPGAGCGGRGVARMFELLEELDLLGRRDYDVVIFDVLGDVVCGGFAAPLRHGFAERAFVVVSEEPLSLYAANNIIHAVQTYTGNGVRLGGLVLNVSDDLAAAAKVRRFADSIGTRIAGIIPRDPAIQEAETRHRSAVEVADRPDTVAAFERLADEILGSFDEEPAPVAPLEGDRLFALLGGRDTPPAAAPRPPAKPDSNPPPGGGVRSTPGGDPRTTRLTGGTQSRAALARLFALDRGRRKDLGLEVTQFTADGGQFACALTSRATGPLRVTWELARADLPSYRQAGRWAVSYEGTPSPGAMKLLDHVAKCLARHDPSPQDLRAVLARDREDAAALVDDSAADRVRESVAPVPRHWCVWGEAGTQGVFFYSEERQRQVTSRLRLGGSRTFNLHHSSDVCQFSKQKTTPYSTHFIRFPWPGEHPEHTHEDRSEWTTTSLQELDLIAGSNHHLRRALDTALAAGEPWDAVSVYVSCSPAVAGEDWAGVIREFRKSYPGPVLTAGINEGDIVRDMATVAQEVLRKAGAQRVPRRERAVHLVGFPATRARRELQELLALAGIEVAQVQVPVVRLHDLPRYPEAAAQLLWPQVEYEPLYESLFTTFPVPAVRVEAPYGLARTVAFVRQAAAAAGADPDFAQEAVTPALEAVRAQLAPLQERASRHRLGVALPTSQLDLLSHPEQLCGLRLVEFLEELGFTVEILTGAEDERRLGWWLHKELSAVYSDVAHDRRLLAAGVGGFSIADIEAGPAGCLRAARRLLTVCETPLFRRYSRWAGGQP